MRSPPSVHTCAHPNISAEASAPAGRTADHILSPACGGPRGDCGGVEGNRQGSPAGRFDTLSTRGQRPSDRRDTRYLGGASLRSRANEPSGFPRGAPRQAQRPRGGARSDRHAPCGKKMRTYVSVPNARPARRPRGGTPTSAARGGSAHAIHLAQRTCGELVEPQQPHRDSVLE
jgi:hypothetical protein